MQYWVLGKFWPDVISTGILENMGHSNHNLRTRIKLLDSVKSRLKYTGSTLTYLSQNQKPNPGPKVVNIQMLR